jgi:hypothetical protein
MSGIDAAEVRRLLLAELPLQRRWCTPRLTVTYDFLRGREGLAPVRTELDARWFDESWTALAIFGTADYFDGGGAMHCLVIDTTVGAVSGLDIQARDAPLFSINSSLPRFIATFRYLDEILSTGRPLPGDAEEVVQRIDPVAFSASDWRAMLLHLRGDDETV